jgi:hypothetical protein
MILSARLGGAKNKAVALDEYIFESVITEDSRISHSECIVNRSRLYWTNRGTSIHRRERHSD